jgi:uncharacterized protein YjbJ (UPF0337 family)
MANDNIKTNPGITTASETDPLDRQQAGAAWDSLKGNWNQLKGKVKEKWGLLTDDDITHIGGHKDRLIGKLQERYGKAKWDEAELERDIRGF